MIPRPAGFRRPNFFFMLKAKRSLSLQPRCRHSDRPSSHPLVRPPQAALRYAQVPSELHQGVGSVYQQGVG